MLPIMKEREASWYTHNDLKGEIPMIHFETWTCENDLLSPPKCKSEVGKAIELQIKRAILSYELIGDDRIVPRTFNIRWNINMLLFDLKIDQEHAKDLSGGNLGFHINSPIKDLKEDMHLLKTTTYRVDRENTLKWKEFLEELLGDILPVKFSGISLISCISNHMIRLMGMETMMYSMVDYPEEFHTVMARISRDYIDFFKWMENENLLLPTNGNNDVGQGTLGFTTDLPSNDSLSKLPRLRKISISPWCNEEYMGEVLKGSKTIFHRKPSPNFVGVGKELDEVAFRQHILKTINAAKGCKLEFTFRDVYNLEGNPSKPGRAVQIVRELLESNW